MASITTARAAKFTFDLDMGRPTEPKRAMPDDVIADLIARARQAGYAEGFAAGENGVTAQTARALAQAAETLAAHGAEMLAALDDARQQHLSEAVELAASVGRKLAGNLLAREPQQEIDALIAECLQSLEGAPHLVIRCHPDLADSVRDTASAQMATSSFSGRLVVMGDPDMALGDCRLEWVDGGLVRDVNAISNDINKRIAAFLATRGAQRRKG